MLILVRRDWIKHLFLSLSLLGSIIAAPVVALAQSSLDSLRTALHLATDDSVRLRIYEQLAKTYAKQDIDSALCYYAQWVDFAQQKGTEADVARAEHVWGITLLSRGHIEEAFLHFSKALKIFEVIKDINGCGRAYNNIGIVFRREGKFREAFLAFLEALKAFKTASNAEGVAMAYNNLAQIYYQYGQYTKALEYFAEYVEYNRTHSLHVEAANGENNIGATYYELKDYQQALKHYYKSYAIYDSLNNQLGLGLASDNIGLILRELGQLTDAIAYHQRAVDIFRQLTQNYQLTMSLGNLCTTYRLAGENVKAKKAGQEALQLADSLVFVELKALVLEELAILNEQANPRQALDYAKRCIKILKDEIQEKGEEDLNEWINNPKLLDEQIRKTAEKQEARIPSYWQYIALVVAFLLGILLSYGLLRAKLRRQKL